MREHKYQEMEKGNGKRNRKFWFGNIFQYKGSGRAGKFPGFQFQGLNPLLYSSKKRPSHLDEGNPQQNTSNQVKVYSSRRQKKPYADALGKTGAQGLVCGCGPHCPQVNPARDEASGPPRAGRGSASFSGLISGVRVLSPALSGGRPGFRGGVTPSRYTSNPTAEPSPPTPHLSARYYQALLVLALAVQVPRIQEAGLAQAPSSLSSASSYGPSPSLASASS